MSPTEPDAWSNLAFAFADTGNPRDGLRCAKRAILLDPHDGDAWSVRGYCEWKIERRDDAIESFKLATNLFPDNWKAFVNMGLCFKEMDRYVESVGSLRKAIAINPEEAPIWFHMAIAQACCGFLAEARQANSFCEECGGDKIDDQLLRQLSEEGQRLRFQKGATAREGTLDTTGRRDPVTKREGIQIACENERVTQRDQDHIALLKKQAMKLRADKTERVLAFSALFQALGHSSSVIRREASRLLANDHKSGVELVEIVRRQLHTDCARAVLAARVIGRDILVSDDYGFIDRRVAQMMCSLNFGFVRCICPYCQTSNKGIPVPESAYDQHSGNMLEYFHSKSTGGHCDVHIVCDTCSHGFFVVWGDTPTRSVPESPRGGESRTALVAAVRAGQAALLYCFDPHQRDGFTKVVDMVSRQIEEVSGRLTLLTLERRKSYASHANLLLVTGPEICLMAFEETVFKNRELQLSVEQRPRRVQNFAPPGFDLSPASRLPSLLDEISDDWYVTLGARYRVDPEAH